MSSGLPVDGGEHRVGRTKPGFISLYLYDGFLFIYMEQVIELGNMPALKIHVQVVKKVDSVFKVGLPLAK